MSDYELSKLASLSRERPVAPGYYPFITCTRSLFFPKRIEPLSLRNNQIYINLFIENRGYSFMCPIHSHYNSPGGRLGGLWGTVLYWLLRRRQRHKRLGRGGLGSVHEDGIVECTRCSDMTVIHHDLYFLLILIVITCNKYSQNFA